MDNLTNTLIEVDGRDIYDQLFERSTVSDLEQNIVTAFPKTKRRQHITDTVVLDSIEYIPYVGMKMLHVRSQTGEHKQAIQFMNVQYLMSDSDDAGYFTDSKTQSEYYIEPIVLRRNTVRVRCSCLDFRFRFAPFNSPDQSLVGKPPPPYVKRSNRPPVNPSQVPGLCKHLLRVVDEMETEGLIA